MIGLKHGTVALYPHERAWEDEAQSTIIRLRNILGDIITDIQHVGSTSVPAIMAKPIIDIAVAVDSFDKVLEKEEDLKAEGFYYRPQVDLGKQLLFACGSYYNGTGDLQTHFIHVVYADSIDWVNYINFRNYLNTHYDAAKAYESLKLSLAKKAPVDNGREKYLKGKHDFIARTLQTAAAYSYLGKTVNIVIDRPVGSTHPNCKNTVYPVNYGYIPGTVGGDGEPIDVYLLGVDAPVKEYTAKIIGTVNRLDDNEDKLAAAPEGRFFTANEIAEKTEFQEKYYNVRIESIFEKSCGTVLFTRKEGKIYYLLITPEGRNEWGFPKGHMEKGEREEETALRETYEETSVIPRLLEGFRHSFSYPIKNGKTKNVVYFLAEYSGQIPENCPGFEKIEYRLLPYNEAYSTLAFHNSKKLLEKANDFLLGNEKNGRNA